MWKREEGRAFFKCHTPQRAGVVSAKNIGPLEGTLARENAGCISPRAQVQDEKLSMKLHQP